MNGPRKKRIPFRITKATPYSEYKNGKYYCHEMTCEGDPTWPKSYISYTDANCEWTVCKGCRVTPKGLAPQCASCRMKPAYVLEGDNQGVEEGNNQPEVEVDDCL